MCNNFNYENLKLYLNDFKFFNVKKLTIIIR